LNERDEARLFRVLDPPPGGLADLRRRIAARESRRAWGFNLATAAVGLAIVIVGIVVSVPLTGPTNLLGDDLVAIQLGLIEPPSEPVSIRAANRGEFAVERVPTSDERVVMYRFGSR